MELATYGRYQAVEIIGEGAMGTVFRGVDPSLGREVAIKTIKPELLAQQPGLQARFEREARIVAGLAHAAIVQVYDFGGDFIVMELVRGAELKSLLQQGRKFTPEEISRLLPPIAEALDLAHGQGIIHRDIKPANIFLDAAGKLKLADFGIAKIVHAAAEGLTASGEVLGTPKYMSPEQVKSEPMDGRSDQFSLTLVVYEMLSGRSAFNADTLSGILYKIINEPPPPIAASDFGLSPAAEQVLLRALSKEPAGRFPDCVAFAREFAAAVQNSDQPAPVPAALSPAGAGAGQNGRQNLAPTGVIAPSSAAAESTLLDATRLDATRMAAPAAPAAAGPVDFKPLLQQQKALAGQLIGMTGHWFTTVARPATEKKISQGAQWTKTKFWPAVLAFCRWLQARGQAGFHFCRAKLTGPDRKKWAVIFLAALLLSSWAGYRLYKHQKAKQKWIRIGDDEKSFREWLR